MLRALDGARALDHGEEGHVEQRVGLFAGVPTAERTSISVRRMKSSHSSIGPASRRRLASVAASSAPSSTRRASWTRDRAKRASG